MLTPRQLEKWRRNMLGRLEVFKAHARQAQQYMAASNVSKLEEKAHLVSSWERVEEQFPEDFVPDRVGDLRRHLHFSQLHDFYDIETFDIPAIEDSVRRYGRGGEAYIVEELNNLDSDLQTWELLHPQIRDACIELFEGRNFRDSARAAVELVMDELRRLSNQDSDGDVLIRHVIGTQPGKLGFSPCTDNNEKSVTEGLKQILQGLFKGIRNPMSHGWNGLSRIEAFQILIVCGLVLSRIQFVQVDSEH